MVREQNTSALRGLALPLICLALAAGMAAPAACYADGGASTSSTGAASSAAATQGDADSESVSVSLVTKVSVKGADLSAGDFKFRITLKDGAPEPQATLVVNEQDGTVDFGSATFSKAGTYTYEVTQIPGDDEGMTYDDSVIKFTVTVKENTAKTGLEATVKASSSKGFTNTYKTPEASSQSQTVDASEYHAADVIITANVSLDTGKSSAGAYSLDVLDASGAVVTTGTNDASGLVRFSTIQIDQAGTYRYTVRPSEGTALSAADGTGEYAVEVSVEDTGTGLLASVSYPDGHPTYTANSTTSQGTGDSSSVADQVKSAISPVMVAIAVVGGLILIVAVVAVLWLQGKSKRSVAQKAGEAFAQTDASKMVPIEHPVPVSQYGAPQAQPVMPDMPVMQPTGSFTAVKTSEGKDVDEAGWSDK